VGDPDTVARRIEEYKAIGIETFIFSGYPHLEEAYRFAELVFPKLGIQGREASNSPILPGPFGEVVANVYAPRVSQS